MGHKYSRGSTTDDAGIYKKNMLPIGEDGGIPIYISKDGKIHAKGFVDTNDNFEFYSEDDSFKVFAKDEKVNYFKEYIFTKEDWKIYRSESFEVLTESFQNIYYPLNPYSNQEPLGHEKKYNLLSKKTKAAIAGATASQTSPVDFHWSFTVNGNKHVEPRVQSAWFGPFNFDVWLDPELMVKDINDLIIVKSGRYNETNKLPTVENVEKVLFSTGVSGHIYLDTPSLPNHNYLPDGDLNLAPKRFKFKNKNNTNRVEETNVPTLRGSGVIGAFYNGVLANSPLTSVSHNDSGVWNVDRVYGSHLDGCNGEIEKDLSIKNYGCYNYKAAPICIFDPYDTSNHSPLLGFSRDGYPIYGPHAYSEPFNPTSNIKRMDTSYRLVQTGSRNLGPDFSDIPSGKYIEDYEYVNNLGDLDNHNGRLCVTPEYPQGTYAYFTTLDSGFSPAYPYVIGESFYGKTSNNEGYDGTVTESPVYYRRFISNEAEMKNLYTDVEINLWDVYGDTNREKGGIQSEKMIYVSPHIIMQDTGVFLYTGKEQSYKSVSGVQQPATYGGNLRMATGNGEFLARKESFSYPTSMRCALMENNPLSGNMRFLYEDPDTTLSIESRSPASVTGTHFYSQYASHKRVKGFVHSGNWAGVIPAGTPFKVENWAFNGDMVGYDGTLCVRPVIPHPLVSGKMITLHALVSGEGQEYDEAYANAMELSKEEMARQLNVLLVNSGVKNKNHRMKAWEKLKGIG